jgi:integrase
VLTASRTGEVIGTRWEEIDMKVRTRTIPAGRAEIHEELRVLLSEPAIDVPREAEKIRVSQ